MTNKQRNMLKKRLLLWGLPGLAVLLLIGLALRPVPIPADVAEVAAGPLLVTVDEEGETRVRDRFMVSAPVSGRLLRISLEPGDEVVAGETALATFQPSTPVPLDVRSRTEAEARVRSAEAALGSAKAQRERADAELRHAESILERYRRLAAESVVSEARLDEVELEYETSRKADKGADYAVGTAEYDLAAARAQLLQSSSGSAGTPGAAEPLVLHSPVSGTVLRRIRWSEAIVPAGEPLLEIGDPLDLEIVADYLSTDAVAVEGGQRVLVEQWGGEYPLAARVRRVEPFGFTKVSALGVEEQRVNVIIEFTGEPERRRALGDGYRVEVRVVVWESDSVLKTPTSSLFRHGDSWAAWVVVDGRATLREIEVGARNGLEAEILGGLEKGEKVVVHPSDAIAEGVKVEIRDV